MSTSRLLHGHGSGRIRRARAESSQGPGRRAKGGSGLLLKGATCWPMPLFERIGRRQIAASARSSKKNISRRFASMKPSAMRTIAAAGSPARDCKIKTRMELKPRCCFRVRCASSTVSLTNHFNVQYFVLTTTGCTSSAVIIPNGSSVSH